MEIPRKYIHDRVVLLLLLANAVLTVLTFITMALRLQSAHSEGYIVQYRGNLGLNAFKVGGLGAISSLMIFAVMVFVLHVVLSLRTYDVRRSLAVTILALGTLLLVLTLIISNSLLILAR
jgi:hypothetical protein